MLQVPGESKLMGGGIAEKREVGEGGGPCSDPLNREGNVLGSADRATHTQNHPKCPNYRKHRWGGRRQKATEVATMLPQSRCVTLERDHHVLDIQL